jgi:hypothetical protein
MRQRGRKSAEALQPAALVSTGGRPDADYSLSDEQSAIWHGTLAALPAGWIGAEALPLLAAYCRTTTALRRLGALLTQAEHGPGEFDPAAYCELLRAHAAQAQTLKTLATALRLTPQSRLRAEKAARTMDGHPTGPRPWEGACDA